MNDTLKLVLWILVVFAAGISLLFTLNLILLKFLDPDGDGMVRVGTVKIETTQQ